MYLLINNVVLEKPVLYHCHWYNANEPNILLYVETLYNAGIFLKVTILAHFINFDKIWTIQARVQGGGPKGPAPLEIEKQKIK